MFYCFRCLSSLIEACQSGGITSVWQAQRPSKVLSIESEGASCGGVFPVTARAGVYQAFAYCPAGTTLVGGGYRFARELYPPVAVSPYKVDAGRHTNSPDDSFPLNGTTWVVIAGGYPDFCFKAIALCAE